MSTLVYDRHHSDSFAPSSHPPPPPRSPVQPPHSAQTNSILAHGVLQTCPTSSSCSRSCSKRNDLQSKQLDLEVVALCACFKSFSEEFLSSTHLLVSWFVHLLSRMWKSVFTLNATTSSTATTATALAHKPLHDSFVRCFDFFFWSTSF